MKMVRLLGGLAALALAQHLCRVFYLTPEDLDQGAVQKIFYIHVPAAIVMYLAFGLALVFGGLYLWRRRPADDAVAAAAMEVGLLLCTAVLLTGPFWARAAWHTWWTWDPRLTLTLFSWFVFLSYFVARRFYSGTEQARLFSAVFLAFGAVALPLIHFSVRFWRGIHPALQGGAAALPAEMKRTFYSGFLTLFVIALFFFFWCLHLRRRVLPAGETR